MSPDLNDDSDTYVCITHQCIAPCPSDGHHLISNWNTDVKKILSLMNKNKTI